MRHDKQLYRAYLRTPEWKAIKLEIHSLRNHKCERCDSTYRLEVHHKTYKNLFNESPKDLELLCHNCHGKEHDKIKKHSNKKYKGKKRNKQYRGKVFKNLYAR